MILVIVLVLFGAKKIPELARGLGTGIKEFKKATRDVQDDLQRAMEEDHQPPPPPKKPAPPAETVAKAASEQPAEPPKV